MGCREGDSVLSQQWRELHRTYEPSVRTHGVSSNERDWTVPTIPRIEHAWVLEPAGSQLITARSNASRCITTPDICPSTASVHSSTVEVRRRPYMCYVCLSNV